MKRFIKTALVIFMLCSVVLMTSCGYTVYDEGIENFAECDSTIEIWANLMPMHHKFIDMFEYTDADYFYHDTAVAPGYRHIERVLVRLEYDSAVYEEAKEYCQENMVLSENNSFEHNGYIFIENIKNLQTASTHLCDYPRAFQMFVYNDSNCTLLFVGFYCTIEVKNEVEKAIEEGWGTFLKKYYGEYYSFE